MRHIGFSSCLADPDVWFRPAIKSDGTPYYEYILLYTDDVLSIGQNDEKVLRQEIGKYFELKEESIGPLKIHLGSCVGNVQLENGAEAWSFSSSQYYKAAVRNVEDYIKTRGMAHSRARTPIQQYIGLS